MLAKKLSKKSSRKMTMSLLLAIILFLTILNLRPDLAFAQVQEWTKLKGDHFIAISKEMYDKALDIISAGDEQALNGMLIARSIVKTVEGTEVYVEHIHPFGGSAEIRLKGDPHIYWVIQKALYSMDSFDKESQTNPVAKQAENTCKLEGVMIENGQPVIFISRRGGVDSIKIGDRVCGGEVLQTYPPGEDDGITSKQSVDRNEYRIKVQLGHEEKIFKNGDVICGDPDSISRRKAGFTKVDESNNSDEMRLKENIRKVDEYYSRAQTLRQKVVLSVKSYEKIIGLYSQAIQEIAFALNKTNAVGEKILKEYLYRYEEERRQLTDRMYDVKDKIRIAKLNKGIVIGMTKEDVIESIGRPYEINRDNYSGDVQEQWVYGVSIAYRKYLYFEDGILTSWQN